MKPISHSIFKESYLWARQKSIVLVLRKRSCSCQITFSISGVVCCWSRSLNGSPGDLWPVDPFSSKVSSSFSRKICWKRPRKSSRSKGHQRTAAAISQFGIFMIFLSLRFYVKSILENLEVLKLLFLQILGLWIYIIW